MKKIVKLILIACIILSVVPIINAQTSVLKDDVYFANYYTDSSKDKNTGASLNHAADGNDYLSGDFYDTSGNNDVYIFRINSKTNVDTVYLTPGEWVKYPVTLEADSYDIDVFYDVNGQSAVFDIMFLDSDGNIKQQREISYSSDKSGRYFNLKEELNRVRLDETVSYIVIKSISGNCAFESFLFKPLLSMRCENIYFSSGSGGENRITRFKDLESIYLNYEITNDSFEDDSIQIYTAFYTEKNKLISVNCDDIDLGGGKSEKDSLKIEIAKDATYLKVFGWMYNEKLIPVADEKVFYSGEDKHFYVDAQNGNDLNSGLSENEALKTITEAKEKVKNETSPAIGDIYVHLEGEFLLDDTICFDETDSGKNGYGVIYEGNDAVISGGKRVTGWSEVEGTPLYQTVISDVEDFRQFYVGDNRAVRARTKWMYYMKDEYDNPKTDAGYADGYVMDGTDFPNGFEKPMDMEFVWHPSWRIVRQPVADFEKTASGDYNVSFPIEAQEARLTVSAPVTVNHPYYIENAPEFLDEPGEFYFNKDTKVLTYYPRENENMEEVDCFIPNVEKLIDLRGEGLTNKIRNITFKGIKFKHGAWEYVTENGIGTRQSEQMITPTGYKMIPAQIQVVNGENINFVENEFTHLGSVALSYSNGSHNSEITGNLFDDNLASAIVIGDWTLEKTDTLEKYPRNINITNNLLKRQSVEYKTPVVSVYQTQNVIIDHNDISDSPCSAISCGWGWGRQYKNVSGNLITNNRITNSVTTLMDGGAIYTLDSNEGGIIKGNYLYDTGHEMIYHDNGSENWTTCENVMDGKHFRWYKITYENIKNNTAYGNFSEKTARCFYPEQNNITEAVGKTDGAWSDEARNIIDNAGLSSKYEYILENYNAKEGLFHSYLDYKPSPEKPGIYVDAASWIDGGEGVAYHEIKSGDGSHLTTSFEPTIWAKYDGSKRKEIGITTQGEWVKYPVYVEKAGYYDVVFELAVTNTSAYASIEVDDEPTFNYVKVKKNCDAYEIYDDYNFGKVYLDEGNHTIKLIHAYKNFTNRALRLVESDASTEKTETYNQNYIDAIMSH